MNNPDHDQTEEELLHRLKSEDSIIHQVNKTPSKDKKPGGEIEMQASDFMLKQPNKGKINEIGLEMDHKQLAN